MMQVANRLCSVIGRHIPFVQMFQYPTIRTLARSLSQDSDMLPSLQQSVGSLATTTTSRTALS
jgi:hypothetical protein